MSGSVSLGGEIVAWNLILEEDIPEATSMLSAGFREYIPCLKSASGNFTSLIPCGVVGAHAAVDFVNAKHTYTMDIIITDISVSDPVDNRVEFAYSFVSSGEIVIA
jgi:hypothetical protein